MSRVSSVGIATGYGLEDRVIGIRFPAGAGNISLPHHVQTCSGTHPASHSMGTGGSLPPSSTEIKEYMELHFHSSNTSSWRGA
jgi:hypothetical protein